MKVVIITGRVLPLFLSLLLLLSSLSLSLSSSPSGTVPQEEVIVMNAEPIEHPVHYTTTTTQNNKFKICVYAIAKNEANRVESFMSWAKHADEVHILDTGSTDNTVQLFQQAGAKVSQRVFEPWRFDHARNAALNLLPQDCEIAVTADMDNVYHPQDQWHLIVQNIWASDHINRLDFPWFYDYVQFPNYWNYDKKYIHSRLGFSWEFPIHEKLLPVEGTTVLSASTDEIQLLEFPTPNVRKTYTSLLELTVQDYPQSAAHHLWLALDYHAQERFLDSIQHYISHLQGDTRGFEWVQSPHVRAFSKRTIGKAYWQHGDNKNAEYWYKEAIKERTDEREVWNDLASFYLATNQPMEAYLTAHRGWQLPTDLRRWDWPVDDCAWSYCLPSLLGKAAFQLNLMKEACMYSKMAYEYAFQSTDKEIMDQACVVKVPDPRSEFPLS